MRLSWLVLVHLCRVSLVILMFKVIFVCFQILWTKYARRCILEAFGACFGLGMDSKCMGQSGWTNLRTKEAKNMKNYGPKDEENSPKICHPNLHSLPCKPHRIPFGFHAMLDHSCPLHNF